MNICDRIIYIRHDIPDTVKLIAVTKQVSVAAMRQAYAAGVRDFGESRIQETQLKQSQLQDLPDITWHLIGRLQANKVKKALELFAWIHSVDSLKLAQRIDKLAAEMGCQPQVCLQVKIEEDANKTGWSVSQLLADLPQLNECINLRIRGLMTIPPLGLNTSEISSIFARTYELLQTIHQQNWSNLQQMQQLSMGMSDDYKIAIASGATMVRLGRTLFGEREREQENA